MEWILRPSHARAQALVRSDLAIITQREPGLRSPDQYSSPLSMLPLSRCNWHGWRSTDLRSDGQSPARQPEIYGKEKNGTRDHEFPEQLCLYYEQ